MKGMHKFLPGLFLLSVLAFAGVQPAGAQQVAVNTNVLLWGALTPNLGVELVTGEHSSVGLSFFGHKNPYGLKSRLMGFQPEYRYWFNGRPMTREYIGVGMLLTTYDITWKEKNVYDGDAVGLGLTGGYVFSLGRRWNLDLSGSFGLLWFHQKQYYVHDNYDDYFVDEAVKTNARGYKLFPVKLGVTFSYIIK